MTITSRILAALLMAAAASSLSACEDDDREPSGNGDAGTQEDGSTQQPEAGGGGNDGGGGQPEGGSEPMADCPTHPNVSKAGDYCVLAAPSTMPVTEPLTIGPVTGKQWVLREGVFIGEDVGGGATPAAGKRTTTLTIQPGTTIRGESVLAFLLVQRGSKIDAQGTPDQPIVFTGLDAKQRGEWGGIVLNGRAPCNQGTDIEGEAQTGRYGGSDPEDDSGTLKFVRIEFGGGKVDSENELNGLALQGVGRGTTLDSIHIHANDDDGIEFFGGTVDARHIVVTATGDDGIDWTGGWSGRLQYAIVQQWPSVSSNDPNGIEADNDQTNNSAAPISNPTLSNITLIGADGVSNSHAYVLRRGTQGKLHSVLAINFNVSCLSVRDASTQGYVGNQLQLLNSRSFCSNPVDTGAANMAASTALFEAAGANNMVLASEDVLSDAFSTTPDFTPKADSGLLTGGRAPNDGFFTAASFIGALGSESWLEGEWVKISPVQ